MGFSTKAKNYFKNELKLNNRQIAEIMDNYSESLVSRFMNSDEVSAVFVLKIKKYFPDAPVDEWVDQNMVNEPELVYHISPVKRINRIINELEELKEEYKKMTQN